MTTHGRAHCGYRLSDALVGLRPRVIGILLAIAGVTYVFDAVANVLPSNYSEYGTVFLC